MGQPATAAVSNDGVADAVADTATGVADGNAFRAGRDALARADVDADGFWLGFAESVDGAAGGGAERRGRAVKRGVATSGAT